MPLFPEPSSSPIALPPPSSTARILGSGSPSSTAKVQVAVVEELARASMDLLDAAEPVDEDADGRELVKLWAKRGPAKSRRMRRASQVALGEIEMLAGRDVAPPSSRELATSPRAPLAARPGVRPLVFVLAAGLVATAVTLALAARFVL